MITQIVFNLGPAWIYYYLISLIRVQLYLSKLRIGKILYLLSITFAQNSPLKDLNSCFKVIFRHFFNVLKSSAVNIIEVDLFN